MSGASRTSRNTSKGSGVDSLGDSNIRTELGEDGVLVATIDMPRRSFNVFSAELMDSLAVLLDYVAERKEVRAVVLRSGKSAFIAGADLEMVRDFTARARSDSPAELHVRCGRLGRLFRRLEVNGKPFVAAVNGLALGGGLELALACHERVAAADAQLGLPEIKLGLLPGAGGTQRLPRLTGRSTALRIMLRGDPMPAARARELGIVDFLASPEQLLDEARGRAVALAGKEVRAPWDRAAWHAPVGADGGAGSDDLDAISNEVGITAQERRHYPAYEAIMTCVVGGWRRPMDEACSWEMDCFVRLIRDPTAGNMIRSLFLDRQRAAKLLDGGSRRPARAVVIGTQTDLISAVLRSARVEIVGEENPAADHITLTTSQPASSQVNGISAAGVLWLRGSAAMPAETGSHVGIWVSDATVHGRAVEVNVATTGPAMARGHTTDEADALAVARWLRSTPLITRGVCFLRELAIARDASFELPVQDRILAVALAAARVWATGAVPDMGIADSAAVVAGLVPAYTGGPFTYLSQLGASVVRGHASEAARRRQSLFAVPDALEALLACSADASSPA
jgi:3-hydroxyacyl-CoA dehydrogenase/enoyl-CoA hydratase/3-hydroxybutyryl-CoA epimerase